MAQCELWVSAFPHNSSCSALLTVPLIFLFTNQYFSLSLLFLIRFLAQNFAPHVETSAWYRFTLRAGLGSVSHQKLSIHIKEQESCFQFASRSQFRGDWNQAPTWSRDFCPKWTFPLLFRAHLYIFTKATVCPNAYISVCLTWKTVFAACWEALFMFFLSLGALLLSQCPSWKTELSCGRSLYTGPLNTSGLLLCFFIYLLSPLSDAVWAPQLSRVPGQRPFHGFHASHLPSSSHCHVTTGVTFPNANLIMPILCLNLLFPFFILEVKLPWFYWVLCTDIAMFTLIFLQSQNIFSS